MSTSIQLVTSQNFTQNKLQEHAYCLHQEVEKITNFASLESKSATQQAQILSDLAVEFRDYICDRGVNVGIPVEQILKDKEIPFSLAFGITQILSQHEIQCYDELKRTLAKTTRIFLELVAFQCAFQERRIYKDTVEQIKQNLDKVRDTLPEKEIEASFDLQCAQSAIKKLDIGIGKWKELAKDHGLDVIKGIFESFLSKSPMPALSPIFNLSVAIYRNIEDRYYRDVWALRWYSAGNRITTKKQLETASELIKKYNTNEMLAFAISEMFIEIMKNSHATEELKSAVFQGNISLLTLVKCNPTWRDNWWKTRCYVLKYLKQLAQDDINPNLRDKSIDAICQRFGDGIARNSVEKELILSTSMELVSQKQWNDRINIEAKRKALLDEIAKINKLKESQIKLKVPQATRSLSVIDKDIEDVKRIKKEAEGNREQSVGDVENYDTEKLTIILNKLMEEKQKTESLEQAIENLEQITENSEEQNIQLESLKDALEDLNSFESEIP